LLNSIASLVTGSIVLVLLIMLNVEKKSIMILIIIIYLFLILFEYLLIGLPSRLIPSFGETENYKVVNILTIANDLSPLVYLGLRISMVSFFLLVIYRADKVKEIDKGIKSDLGIKEF